MVECNVCVVLLLGHAALGNSLAGRVDDAILQICEGFLAWLAHLARLSCENYELALVHKACKLCCEVAYLNNLPCTVVAECCIVLRIYVTRDLGTQTLHATCNSCAVSAYGRDCHHTGDVCEIACCNCSLVDAYRCAAVLYHLDCLVV